MSGALVAISLGLALLVGTASYFWGLKTQTQKNIGEHLKRIDSVRAAEARARKAIENDLQALEITRNKFDKLPWATKMDLLGIKEDKNE